MGVSGDVGKEVVVGDEERGDLDATFFLFFVGSFPSGLMGESEQRIEERRDVSRRHWSSR